MSSPMAAIATNLADPHSAPAKTAGRGKAAKSFSDELAAASDQMTGLAAGDDAVPMPKATTRPSASKAGRSSEKTRSHGKGSPRVDATKMKTASSLVSRPVDKTPGPAPRTGEALIAGQSSDPGVETCVAERPSFSGGRSPASEIAGIDSGSQATRTSEPNIPRENGLQAKSTAEIPDVQPGASADEDASDSDAGVNAVSPIVARPTKTPDQAAKVAKEAKEAPSSHGERGRQSGTEVQRPKITESFLSNVTEPKPSSKAGLATAAAIEHTPKADVVPQSRLQELPKADRAVSSQPHAKIANATKQQIVGVTAVQKASLAVDKNAAGRESKSAHVERAGSSVPASAEAANATGKSQASATASDATAKDCVPTNLQMPDRMTTAGPSLTTTVAGSNAAKVDSPERNSTAQILEIQHSAASVLQSAKLSDRAGHVELHVGLNAGELGNVAIRTFMLHNQVKAEISVQHEEARNVLAVALPDLQNRIMEKQGSVPQIVLSAGAGDTAQHSKQTHEGNKKIPESLLRADAVEVEAYPAGEGYGPAAQLDVHM